jgi:hypothetical protein
MVAPFPEPGQTVRAAMSALQRQSTTPAETDIEMETRALLPKPWDPASCSGALRQELWWWLEDVAIWINEQHLWNLARPGIPDCWPAHPHLVHELAAVAAARYYTRYAATPAALEDWQHHCLAAFLERIRERLGAGCQPGQHSRRPRHDRDGIHASQRSNQIRARQFVDDVTGSSTQAENAVLRPR